MKRRTALYCTVISEGPLLVLRMPESLVRWPIVRKELNRFMRERYAVKAKDIYALEGLAGMPDGAGEDMEFLARCHRAFEGDADCLSRFNLAVWDGETFQHHRDAVR